MAVKIALEIKEPHLQNSLAIDTEFPRREAHDGPTLIAARCKRMELVWIGIGAIAAMVVAAIAYRLWRKRKRDDKPDYYKSYPLW